MSKASSEHLDVQKRIQNLIRWVGSNPSFIAKGIRFGMVGATSGLIFSGTTALLVSGFDANPKLASAVGYVTSMPINFIANRKFAFQSEGHWLGDVIRFCVLHLANIALTAGAMSIAVDALGLHYLFGVIAAILLVPVANFVAMYFWVFGQQADSRGKPE